MKNFLIITLIFLSSIQPARAGGGGFAGATEWTQILNNLQLADQYAQQVLQYQNQLMQYDTMLKNLANHPLGNISPELYKLASNSSKVIAASKDIGSNMAKVDKNFADQFNSPLAKAFGERFKGWSENSNDALKAAMLSAGLQRENFKSDEAALAALVKKNEQSEGALAAAKTLGEINAAQVQEMQKLRDLISQQQIAENTYMVAKTSKEQAVQDINDSVGKSTPLPTTMVIPEKGKYKY